MQLLITLIIDKCRTNEWYRSVVWFVVHSSLDAQTHTQTHTNKQTNQTIDTNGIDINNS